MSRCSPIRRLDTRVARCTGALIGAILGISVFPITASALTPEQSPRDVLDETAAVVEGRVTSVDYTFDVREGPRSVATLEDLTVHFGTLDADSVELRTLGGPLPDGKVLHVSEMSRLTIGTRFIVLLQAGDWFLAPIVGLNAFRLELDNARRDDILIGQSGTVLVDLTDQSFEFSATQVVKVGYDMAAPFAPNALDLNVAPAAFARGISKRNFLLRVEELGGVEVDTPFEPFPLQRDNWAARRASAQIEPVEEDLVCSEEPIECSADTEGGY